MKLEEKFLETVKRLKEKSDHITILVATSTERGLNPTLENLKKDIICSIESKIENEKHHQYYIDYILGYLTTKPNALIEDIEAAIDVGRFVRENKHLYENETTSITEMTPTQLGLKHSHLQCIMLELKQKSKNEWTRMKNEGTLPKGMNIEIVYEDKQYKVYKVPKIGENPTEEAKEEQHLKLCVIGKNTKWCTANPIGTYYSYYLNDDIYAVWENGKPLYQFSIRKGSVGQFMDVNDRSVDDLKKDLIEILESLFQ